MRGYDDSWDEFWEATALTYTLGPLAIGAYWLRRETPSAFVYIELAVTILSYTLLLFISPIAWLGVDLMLFTGTFIGWFFSSIFRPVT